MDIDISSLTFRDASKEEKKRIFRVLNLRGTIWLLCSILAIIAIFLIPGRLKWFTALVLALAGIVLIYNVINDMPAWNCKVCKGIVSNKREVSASKDTGLYYDAVTFTSENGETMEAMPVFSNKTLRLLEEGSHATIVCYNKREPIILADEQLQ
ncbi:MAG: hypothetical protein J6T40_08075 [Clostridiales bacterium]|nr:hypothetical protein [Clostridiales bacterium]